MVGTCEEDYSQKAAWSKKKKAKNAGGGTSSSQLVKGWEAMLQRGGAAHSEDRDYQSLQSS